MIILQQLLQNYKKLRNENLLKKPTISLRSSPEPGVAAATKTLKKERIRPAGLQIPEIFVENVG